MFKTFETDDFDGLQEMFLKNGLEVSENVSDPAVTKCWEIKNGDERIAGMRLEKREEEFVIVGIFVDKRFRNNRLGSLLLDSAIRETKKRGGKRIILVAKAPGFFEKAGFVPLDAGRFESIIGCGGCGQLNKSCFPKFLGLEL